MSQSLVTTAAPCKADDRWVADKLPMVRGIARRLPRWCRDDCEGAGMLKLVEVAQALAAGRIAPHDLDGFTAVAVRRAMIDELRALSPPTDAAGNALCIPLTDKISDTLAQTHDDFERVDIEDELTLCADDRERQILLLRLDGLTDAEIGARLGCHQGNVTRARDRVANHLLQESSLDLSC